LNKPTDDQETNENPNVATFNIPNLPDLTNGQIKDIITEHGSEDAKKALSIFKERKTPHLRTMLLKYIRNNLSNKVYISNPPLTTPKIAPESVDSVEIGRQSSPTPESGESSPNGENLKCKQLDW
jgi:hypothetical protein